MKSLIQENCRLFSRKEESDDEFEIFLRSKSVMNLFESEEEEDRRKKEEDTQKKKKEILERQLQFRKINNNSNNQKENIKEVLEDMCVLGSIMKKEIIQEKKNNPEKFISIEEATKEENKNNGTFCLGILAKTLEDMGIMTAIEKNASNDEEAQNASTSVLQFITNGMIEKKKYDFHFDLGDEKNKELLNNKEEQEKFNNILKKKLSLEYNISENKIIITNPQKGSYRIQVIFETDNFNDKKFDINTFKENFSKEEEFKELESLKEIHTSLIMEGCKLTPDMLDPRGNREFGWGKNEKRGGFDYTPPEGWKGFGLKVVGKYDDGNDDWLAYNGNEKEWAIAYHGIGIGEDCKTVENSTLNIVKGGFKAGSGQLHRNEKNINKRYKPNDINNDHSKTVGKGVYCSPNPEVMESYAQTSSTTINGKHYKMGFMMRVKPDKIRISKSNEEYWVLDGTTNEMRPYRIMLKEC